MSFENQTVFWKNEFTILENCQDQSSHINIIENLWCIKIIRKRHPETLVKLDTFAKDEF